ncbi:HAD-IIB family hydrolase [Fictibacillus nanhaiensis]|uniref:HAD-IIB family hydrolase n=1 Tax=Fictibacillus nanhaiensis TaxID=742169 RepID=UPI001C95AE0A|nr:HAD-IIB family hydrolase [Fictibacillus nanhaiensis]MBY6037688.1 HAD-IIB family hydrolase [Fictibacillus nanhaiensis]
MYISKISQLKRVNEVRNPRNIVFFDFDETYFPHEIDSYRYEKLSELEDYLLQKAEEKQLVFGWVTGSSIESVINKMEKGRLTLLPHFIASNLGTEITYFYDNCFNKEDSTWEKMLNDKEFSSSVVESIVNVLYKEHGIMLEGQTNLGGSKYKKNFYYREESPSIDVLNLETIRRLANNKGILVNINKCNPMAGDPEDCYDIDFIPLGTGKDKIVEFMLNKYQVTKNNAYAFGDSGNDLLMLNSVENGFLVENATVEAKSKHSKISLGSYSEGILNTLHSLNQN